MSFKNRTHFEQANETNEKWLWIRFWFKTLYNKRIIRKMRTEKQKLKEKCINWVPINWSLWQESLSNSRWMLNRNVHLLDGRDDFYHFWIHFFISFHSKHHSTITWLQAKSGNSAANILHSWAIECSAKAHFVCHNSSAIHIWMALAKEHMKWMKWCRLKTRMKATTKLMNAK